MQLMTEMTRLMSAVTGLVTVTQQTAASTASSTSQQNSNAHNSNRSNVNRGAGSLQQLAQWQNELSHRLGLRAATASTGGVDAQNDNSNNSNSNRDAAQAGTHDAEIPSMHQNAAETPAAAESTQVGFGCEQFFVKA